MPPTSLHMCSLTVTVLQVTVPAMPSRTRVGVRTAASEKVCVGLGSLQEPPLHAKGEVSPSPHVRVPVVAEPVPVMVAVTTSIVVALEGLRVQVGAKTCKSGKGRITRVLLQSKTGRTHAHCGKIQ